MPRDYNTVHQVAQSITDSCANFSAVTYAVPHAQLSHTYVRSRCACAIMHNVYMRVSHMMYLDVYIRHLDHDHDMM